MCLCVFVCVVCWIKVFLFSLGRQVSKVVRWQDIRKKEGVGGSYQCESLFINVAFGFEEVETVLCAP